MRFFCLLLFWCCTIVFPQAQIQSTFHGGAKAQAMGNAYPALGKEVAIWGNPAGLSDFDYHALSFYGYRPFLQTDIQLAAGGFAFHTNSGIFALSVQQQGFADYREQAFGLAYARQLLPNLSIGGRVDVQRFSIAEYGNTQSVTFDLGFRLEAFDNFYLGAHIYSPFKVAITPESNLATLFGFGATYRVSEKVLLAIGIQKHELYPLSVQAGMEYTPGENVFIRLGAQSQPTEMSFGLGYRLPGDWRIDFSGTYHQALGLSPGIGVNYCFKT